MTTYRRFDQATEFEIQTVSGPVSAIGNNQLIAAPGANLPSCKLFSQDRYLWWEIISTPTRLSRRNI